ncbi:NmrA family protein [Burkholderia multivorans]|uniref:NmrA family protein n=1 Tax=Burkholderia multivorans TaxID=87883 RepID=A0ABD7LI28_9BURK|nr:NmrA family NAD(P)-binding protein [Burkholderia multivorans]SAK15346.1 NmrA family protein [Burkholderia multivorans]
MTILVVAATGRVARAALESMLERNVPVRALVRDASKLRAWFGPDIFAKLAVVDGEFDDPSILHRAFDDVTEVYLGLGTSPRQIDIEKCLIDAAARAGVRQLVRLSVFDADVNADYEVARRHGELDAYLVKSNVPHTRICPTYFMSNLLFAASAIANNTSWSGMVPTGRVAMVDARDVGEAAAEVLLKPSLQNKTYYLSGPQSLTFEEAASAFSRILKRVVEYKAADIDTLRRGYAARGVPTWLAEIALGIDAAMQKGRHERVTSDLTQLLAHAPRTLDDFIRDHLALFSTSHVSV